MRWNWIDRILRHDPGERDAIKVVSLSEDHLHEHFVDAPCMPSSLMIEGMAQTAGILVGAISNFERRVILAKIARAEFQADAFPGDQIRYSATLERMADAGASTEERWRSVGPMRCVRAGGPRGPLLQSSRW